MKTLIKSLALQSIYEFLRERRRQYLDKHYFEQSFIKIKCGAYEIEAPKNHLLVKVLEFQPYRDMCVGITAKYISAKYPNKAIIDIGANIGDTAAIIATYAQNKLILIEASDYYFDILVNNTLQLPNEVITKNCLISDGNQISGSFTHRGGTAFFREEASGEIQIKTVRLSSLTDENVCFIKTDTDGYDFKILNDNLEWLASARPAILFENQILNNQDLDDSNELLTRLAEIDYAYFIVWDDAGFHLLSTTSLDVLKDLNRYLFKVWETRSDKQKNVYNFDVLCLNLTDEDVYKNICEWYRKY
jgi:FkbM family methyltransferase